MHTEKPHGAAVLKAAVCLTQVCLSSAAAGGHEEEDGAGDRCSGERRGDEEARPA